MILLYTFDQFVSIIPEGTLPNYLSSNIIMCTLYIIQQKYICLPRDRKSHVYHYGVFMYMPKTRDLK